MLSNDLFTDNKLDDQDSATDKKNSKHDDDTSKSS